MNTIHSDAMVPVAALLALLAGIFSFLLCMRYTGLRGGNAVVAALVTLVAAAITGTYHFNRYAGHHFQPTNSRLVISTLCVALFVSIASAFGIRLYRKWLGGHLTEEERAPGRRGFHAWLSPANVIVAALLSVCAWQGFGWSLLLMLVLTFGLLVVWPALHANTVEVPSKPASPESFPREREKVLSLLEAGKITAEESAELLHALAANPAGVAPQKPAFPRSSLGLAGAALVLVGFFLPWFSFSPTEQAATLLEGFEEAGLPMVEMSKVLPKQTVSVRGGDIANGLGWAVLVLALASFVLPAFARNFERGSLRAFRILTLLGGAIILVYVLSQDIRSVSIGLVLVLIGYACAGIALWREEGLSLRSERTAEAGV
jgi:hypothetical protein